jgi:PAS domain S-box-containing protein
MIGSKSGRLLVVDDDIEFLTPVCDLLSKWGYEVTEFTTAKDTTKALKKQDFDLLLVDLVMPDMDGIELVKVALKIEPLLVCIIITAEGTIQTAVEAMKAGAFDYISKPMDWKMLRTVLSRAMEVRRLKKSEEKYRAIVEHQTELICSWNLDGTITYVNEVFCRYFGKTNQEIIGNTFPLLISEKEREEFKNHISSFNSENPVITLEHSVNMASGEIRWQKWINQAIFDEQGSIHEIHSVGCDITELKYSEGQRRDLLNIIEKAKQEWEMTFDSVKEFIVIINRDFKIIRSNTGYAEFLGIPVQKLIGRRLFDFAPFYPNQIGYYKGSMEKGELITKSEIKTETGEWFYINQRPFKNEKDEIIHSVIVMTEITDLKTIQTNLMDSEANLKKRVKDLEDFYDMSVHRELKMKELKEEIERLKKKSEENKKSE